MFRFIRVSILAVTALAISAGACANHPDPALSDVPDSITLSPGPHYGVGTPNENPIGLYVVHVEGPIGEPSITSPDAVNRMGKEPASSSDDVDQADGAISLE